MKNITVNGIVDSLIQIEELRRVTAKLASELCERLKEGYSSETAMSVERIIKQFSSGAQTLDGKPLDLMGAMLLLDSSGVMTNREMGTSRPKPTIETSCFGSYLTTVIKAQGGYLEAYVCPSDCGTAQAGTAFRKEREGAGVELTLAEVKAGEIAECDGKPADNRDVDIYVYGDPYDEDFTEKLTLSSAALQNVLSDAEECLKC